MPSKLWCFVLVCVLNCVLCSKLNTFYRNDTGLLINKDKILVWDLSTDNNTSTPSKVLPEWYYTKNIDKRSDQEIVFRVTNGEVVKAGEVPYQISLRIPGTKKKYKNLCGGSVIGKLVLISAARCFVTEQDEINVYKGLGRVREEKLKELYAVAGSVFTISDFHGGKDTDEQGQWRLLRTVYIPKDFNYPEDDISVVFVRKPFVWTKFVKPLPIASKEIEYTGKCLASGYGTKEEGHSSKYLRKAYLQVLNSTACSVLNKRNMNKFVCTLDEVSDVTKTDIGGPLVCFGTDDPNEKSLGIVVGVVSLRGANIKTGSYFTRVTSYYDFINQALKLKPKDLMRKEKSSGIDSVLRPSLFVSIASAIFYLFFSL